MLVRCGAAAFGEQEQDAGQQADAEASKVGIDFGGFFQLYFFVGASGGESD